MSFYNGLIAAPLDVAAVTASQALNPTTPIANLFDDRPRRLVESTSTNLTLDVNMGAATSFNLVAVLFTNAGADSSWSIRVADDQAGLDTAADLVPALTDLWASPSGDRYPRRHGFAFFAAQTKAWLRITIIGGTITGNRLQIGRLVIANALQPGWNYALGSTIGRQPLIDEKRSRTGQVSRRLWQRRRVLQLRFPELTEDELYGELDPIAEKADESPILIIQEPATDASYRMEKMFYGELVVQSRKIHENEFDARLQLTEWT